MTLHEDTWPDGVREARTLLFVPGTRPERFAKARDSGADAIIVDLEDAIDVDLKDAARTHALQWLAAGERAIVRINAVGTPWFEEDLAALGGDRPVAVLLPKAESARAVERVSGALPTGSVIVACIETALGVDRAAEIAGSGAAVVRLAFGNMDFARDLGLQRDHGPLVDHAGATVAITSRAHGLAAPIAGVTATVSDTHALARDTALAIDLGFSGKVCIHPAQVTTVAEGFAPSPDLVAWAERIMAASAADAVHVVDGEMVDRPIVERAAAILRRARKDGARALPEP